MRRDELDAVLAFGHHGRPVLVFPAQNGNRYEWEERGMVAAVGDLLEGGRVKLYCVDSWDAAIWHDEWLRAHASLLLVVGRGAWEDSTGSLDQTHRFAALLAEKGTRHELDVWGEDTPHDWPAWRAQIAHHLPRFV